MERSKVRTASSLKSQRDHKRDKIKIKMKKNKIKKRTYFFFVVKGEKVKSGNIGKK